MTPALLDHDDHQLAVHRIAAESGDTARPAVVRGDWRAPESGEAVISQPLAARLSLSVGDGIKTTHQLPNGAAWYSEYTVRALASVQPGFELSVFVMEPAGTPCASRDLSALPSSACPVFFNSPQGAALGAVMPRPTSMSLSAGEVGLSGGLAKRLGVKVEDPVLLTARPLRNQLFRVAVVVELDDQTANDATLYLSHGVQLSSCDLPATH